MQRTNARLSQQIAQEAQLLAEEKWIIDAVKALKRAKNSLTIERLHLESTRTKHVKQKSKQSKRKRILESLVEGVQASAVEPPTEDVQPSTSRKEVAKRAAPQEQPVVVPALSQLDVPVAGIDDEMCNNEELNLSVTDSVFNNPQLLYTLDMEEDLEDEEDMANTPIDMNMLMQSKPR